MNPTQWTVLLCVIVAVFAGIGSYGLHALARRLEVLEDQMMKLWGVRATQPQRGRNGHLTTVFRRDVM